MKTIQPHTTKLSATWLGLLLSVGSASMSVLADDVEIYLHAPPDPVPPNVLFILDESGSMNSSPSPSRRDRLEDAMKTLFNDPDMQNVNAAMMGYTTNWGENGPLWLIAHTGNFSIIEDNRTALINAAESLTAINNHYTPTVKALEAGVNWFRRDRTFTDANGFTTTSPIDGTPQDNWCRPNHIVLLTDGLPNSNSTTSGLAYGLSSYEGAPCASDSTSQYQNGRCAREIAAYAYNTDLETGAGWSETQNIVTHTIGFDTDSDTGIRNFMVSIAAAGGGDYYPASSVDDLVDAFSSIVIEAQESIPYAYTAPVIPFNQDNAAVSGNHIYVPLLVPSGEIFWRGNLKSYTIRSETSGDEVSIVIEDADGDPIINENYDFISSRDHWNSSGEDGGDPLVGGAAQMMTSTGNNRNLYTNTNPDASLSDATNRVHRDNDLVTYSMLGVADGDDATRDTLLNWISWDPTLGTSVSESPPGGAVPCAAENATCTIPNGVSATVWYGANSSWYHRTNVTGSIGCNNSVFGDPLWGTFKGCYYSATVESHEGEMGAPIHTQPSVVNYVGGDVIYLPTSEGVLEAIDAETGEELWAFMPSDLLVDISTLYTNDAATIPHYGLDGPLTIYETVGHTMAIFGMRRGGYSYYLLDITDRLDPQFITQIYDPDTASTGSDYDGLGQTWSKPLLARMYVGGTVTDVLVFGGGYDPDQDGTTTRSNDDQGNAIYIIRASDGSFIQKISNDTAGISGLNNSIPSDVLPFDINRNGILDRLYAADVGGRIIRIDIPEDGTTSLTGGVIADINTPATSQYRRFFNTPEIGYYNRGGVQYLAILIGSGDRTSPLDQSVTDRFYMIRDNSVWTAPSTYVTISQSDLYNATDNLIQDGTIAQQSQAQADLASNHGWYIDFGLGEKSFSDAVLYNYAVLFTTYSAERSAELASCQARDAIGSSRFYTVNMVNGAAMFAGLGGTETTLDINDRSRLLNMSGLPPTPTLVFPDITSGNEGGNVLGSVVKAYVGLEEVNEWPMQFIPIWWEEVIP